METNIAYIALGSNLGNKRLNIENAIKLIGKIERTTLVRTSGIYKTVPEGRANQPSFLNAVAEIHTSLSTDNLLDRLMQAEKQIGRTRSGKRNEPRVIDLDILLYGQETYHLPHLIIPHPRMHRRRFVLEPLCEIAPDLIHPVLHKTMRALLKKLPYENNKNY